MPIMDMLPKGDTLQIPLDAPTSLAATAGNAQVELTWTDPKDKYATPEGEVSETGDQLVSEWSHTVLVRKTGSQPAGPDDGTVVVSSSVRNQYQSTAYVDSGLTNGTTYYYGAYAYNKDGVASEGAVTSAAPITSTAIGDLTVGSIVKTNVNGSPYEFIVVHQGLPSSLYDSSCNGTWLLLKDLYANTKWNPSRDEYPNSSVHQWCDSTFIGMLETGIIPLVKQVKIPYSTGTGYGMQVNSGANGLSCKSFLLTPYELGFTRDNDSDIVADGAKLDYFDTGTTEAANNKRVGLLAGTAGIWWTRFCYDQLDSWSVTSTGTGAFKKITENAGARPAVILDSSARVTPDLQIIPVESVS